MWFGGCPCFWFPGCNNGFNNGFNNCWGIFIVIIIIFFLFWESDHKGGRDY